MYLHQLYVVFYHISYYRYFKPCYFFTQYFILRPRALRVPRVFFFPYQDQPPFMTSLTGCHGDAVVMEITRTSPVCVCVSFEKCSYVPPPRVLCCRWTALGTGFIVRIPKHSAVSFSRLRQTFRTLLVENSGTSAQLHQQNNRCGFS